MPHSCAAINCQKRFTVETRAAGITFHRFPKESSMKKQWIRAVRRKDFTPSNASRICSEHFKPEDFDRTGQTVRLREGVVPSVFSFPTRRKKPPATNTTKTSPKKQDSKVVNISPPAQEPEPLPSPDLDHSYALPPSPGDLKAKLNEALERVESLEREMRNAKDRERRAKTALQVLLMDLRGKNIIDEDLKQRHGL
ncbi:PREDICTED: THAP domain-containing protein 6-like [Cyprinodon variegatus]|uniref:Si:ch73-130a3.4 n=1 Tax=Cyprinodon variegatus TaxID=28743 RepID=A0A3Q2CDC5_CYPVA|nr:PREDICTED: THAP domain-containing protein 6-like [Cyprinodon variegatus]